MTNEAKTVPLVHRAQSQALYSIVWCLYLAFLPPTSIFKFNWRNFNSKCSSKYCFWLHFNAFCCCLICCFFYCVRQFLRECERTTQIHSNYYGLWWLSHRMFYDSCFIESVRAYGISLLSPMSICILVFVVGVHVCVLWFGLKIFHIHILNE